MCGSFNVFKVSVSPSNPIEWHVDAPVFIIDVLEIGE